MTCKHRSRIAAACGRVAQLLRMRHAAATRSEPNCSPALLWPPDDLTRPMMQADGVTEADLEVLLRGIAASRARD
jgi:hypothetical protein